MKKVILILLMAFTFFTACKNDVDGDEEFNSYSFDDSNYLVITNPSKSKKASGEIWIRINSIEQSRQTLVDSSNIMSVEISMNDESIEHTLPYIQEDLGQLNLKKERAAMSSVKATGYKLNEKKNILDYYNNINDTATMVYEGEYCYIWTYNNESADSKLSNDEIKDFADKFDIIYVKETALCGPKYEGITVYDNVIPPDKKISIILCDIGRDKGNGNVYGYFHPRNYHEANQMEIIFVDSYFVKTVGFGVLFSTLAHEFNHLLNYCNKTLKYGLSMDTWFTEMLSMVTEDYFTDDLNLSFSDTPNKRLLAFIGGSYIYGFGNWFNDSPYVGSNYANAYAFGAFLARNFGGVKLIHEIMTNELVNEESVEIAVNKLNGTSYTFSDLLEKFACVLINPHNDRDNLLSLFKSSDKEKLNESDNFYFELKKIDLENLSSNPEVKTSISSKNINDASDLFFDSYGFHFYSFENTMDIKVLVKNHLKVYAF